MATAELTRTSSSPAPAGKEADLYAEIVRRWYWSISRGGHIQRPVQPFVLGPNFAASVAQWPDSVYGHIVAACARVVSLHNWELLGRVKVTKHAKDMGTQGQEGLDPVTAAWYPLDGAPELGIHFWRLGGGIIDVRSVGPFKQAPALQFGRFAAETLQLEEDIREAVKRRIRRPR
jgi:hypothetical protein